MFHNSGTRTYYKISSGNSIIIIIFFHMNTCNDFKETLTVLVSSGNGFYTNNMLIDMIYIY